MHPGAKECPTAWDRTGQDRTGRLTGAPFSEDGGHVARAVGVDVIHVDPRLMFMYLLTVASRLKLVI